MKDEETLEEAAEKYINDDLDLYESLVDGHISYNIGINLLNKLFVEGAKWQQKRMYSKEDMINFAWFLKENLGQYSYDKTAHFKGEYLEQFKKK